MPLIEEVHDSDMVYPLQAPSQAESVQPNPAMLHLTPAGVRKTLNRRMREKPLLELCCHGCKRTTHSPDTYVAEDYLEWQAGYYKLTPKMSSMGIREQQPHGNLCHDCSSTIRRGFPTEKKAVMQQKLLQDERWRITEFLPRLQSHQDDVREKIQFGNARIKKKTKSVIKAEETVVTNRVPGIMMELEKYKEACGLWVVAAQPFKVSLLRCCFLVLSFFLDPSSTLARSMDHRPRTSTVSSAPCIQRHRKRCRPFFIPKHMSGVWEADLARQSRVRQESLEDDNASALCAEQVSASQGWHDMKLLTLLCFVTYKSYKLYNL